MKISRHLLAGQQGVVLFSSLTILSVLLAVGIGVRTMLQNDYKILANLRGGMEAFYFSVAGIEWSKSELGRTLILPPAPANRPVRFQSGSFSISLMSTTSGPRRIGGRAFDRFAGNFIAHASSATHQDLRSCRCRHEP